MKKLTVVCWNFERNGAGDPALRVRGHELVARHKPQLVLRQEMWGADAAGGQILYELERVLGLRGWLGPKSSTAIFADPAVFEPLREWPEVGPMWIQPPTALTFRFVPAGADSLPLNVVSYHLNYASSNNRLTEAEWLTYWADKYADVAGESVPVPALMGGDNNSYPVPGEDVLPLPVLEEIPNRPHRVHRSRIFLDGLVMDTRPDGALRTAGLEDVARHWARGGHKTALARTVNASPTHGPDSRIDRIYATPELLPAVAGVDVVEVEEEVSDHHIVRLVLDVETLTDVLRHRRERQ